MPSNLPDGTTQLSTTISERIKRLLNEMCENDLVKYRSFLERIIEAEHDRRERANALVDTPVEYHGGQQ